MGSFLIWVDAHAKKSSLTQTKISIMGEYLNEWNWTRRYKEVVVFIDHERYRYYGGCYFMYSELVTNPTILLNLSKKARQMIAITTLNKK